MVVLTVRIFHIVEGSSTPTNSSLVKSSVKLRGGVDIKVRDPLKVRFQTQSYQIWDTYVGYMTSDKAVKSPCFIPRGRSALGCSLQFPLPPCPPVRRNDICEDFR